MIFDFKYVQKEQKDFIEHLKHKEGRKYQDEYFSVPMWLVLALQSELAEILNASKIHKWWDCEKVDEKHLLEECADFLAHLGNLANMLEVDLITEADEIQITCLESQFNKMFYKITTLPWKKQFARNTLLNSLLPQFIELVYSLGFNIEQLEKAYLEKMKCNYKRFEQGRENEK